MDTISSRVTENDRTGSTLPDYSGQTYYDQPALKPAPFRWVSALYLAVSGLAAGAQLVATVVRAFGPPRLQCVARNGRYLGLLGATIGPLLLIADLKTPRRWYNMLRIFRRTSPMSLGSYIVTSFGVSSLLAVWSEQRSAPWARSRLSLVDIPATVSAAGLSTYTAALFASTSTPLWSAAPRLLGARFATSSFATGAAALTLAEHAARRYENTASLDIIAALATAADFGVSMACERAYEQAGVGTPLREGLPGTANQAAILVGGALPLVCYALGALGGRPVRTLSVVAALGILTGNLLMRMAFHEAGKASARRPRDYFRTTQLPHVASQVREEPRSHSAPARALVEGTS